MCWSLLYEFKIDSLSLFFSSLSVFYANVIFFFFSFLQDVRVCGLYETVSPCFHYDISILADGVFGAQWGAQCRIPGRRGGASSRDLKTFCSQRHAGVGVR